MAINTLITIKDTLTAWANGHGQLQGRIMFEADDHRSAYITAQSEFPVMFVAPIDVEVGRAMNTHTLRVYIYERLNDDRLDVIENANDTSLILRDIRVWWNDYGTDDIQIVEDPIGQFGCDKELDNLVGYFADIRFEIPSHGRCQVPVDIVPNPPEPIVCAPVDVYIGEANAGSFPSGSDVFVKVIQDGFEVIPEDITVAGDEIDVVLADSPSATVNVNGNLFATVTSGGTENVPVVNEGSNPVGTISGDQVVVANSDVFINTIQVGDIDAEDSLSINVTLDGVNSGSWNAGTQTWEVVGVPSPPPIGATLMKTGQTTSYRAGDDGDIEAGRATSFFVLDQIPVHSDGSPTANTTTNRFTDELGGQTYTNNIVIDWSTYNNVANTVLGYTRNFVTIGFNWNVSIDSCLSYSIGSFSTGWRMPNYKEMLNIYNQELTILFTYAPFSLPKNVYYWVSNSVDANNKVRLYGGGGGGTWIGTNYANASTESTMRCIAVRTFTVTGTTLT